MAKPTLFQALSATERPASKALMCPLGVQCAAQFAGKALGGGQGAKAPDWRQAQQMAMLNARQLLPQAALFQLRFHPCGERVDDDQGGVGITVVTLK